MEKSNFKISKDI